MRTCEYCDRDMRFKNAHARFCSDKCRNYARRAAAKNGPRFPKEMTGSPRWMRWKPVRRGDRVTKMPITTTGKQASSTNAETWATFAEANASDKGAGLGFALGNGIGCIDLDHCLTDGVVAEWAQDIVDRCPPTFMEVSQSGTGIHVFGLLPEGAGRKIRRGDVAVEFYSVGRFMAVTGERFNGSPSSLADLSEVVASIS